MKENQSKKNKYLKKISKNQEKLKKIGKQLKNIRVY